MTGAQVATGSRDIYTVSRLNREARFILNELFGTLWIEGELSNLSSPSSGHLYFTLKDADAQVRCAMFRPQVRSLGFKPENGDHVLIEAQVGLYEPRGDFQLIVATMEQLGDGALLRAFEALKRRLAAEGLFDAAHKKPIPTLPRCVGVVTSPTGAALRDVLTVLKRRFPALPVVVFPVKVQGSEARHEIVRALAQADRLGLCDVLILTRGGGAPEDLWTFNDEMVVRAIHACRVPVVSAVGHEIDVTLADWVADLRAPTPSAAAVAVSPDRGEWLDRFRRLEARLRQGLMAHLERSQRLLGFLEKRLQQLHPGRRLPTQAQRLDELELRLRRALRQRLAARADRLHALRARLLRHRPEPRLAFLQAQHALLLQRLVQAIRRPLEAHGHALARLGQQLQAVSPLATLARGYTITSERDTGTILRSCRSLEPGAALTTRFPDGLAFSRVEGVQREPIAHGGPTAGAGALAFEPVDIPPEAD